MTARMMPVTDLPQTSFDPIRAADLLDDDGVLKAVARHAGRAYPEECCGYIDLERVVHPAVNVQSDLHAADPDQFARDGRRAFRFSPADQLRLARSLRSDRPAICIYHSHPDTSAYFSDKDIADALYENQPKLPVTHLVIGMPDAVASHAKLYRFDGQTFVECWRRTLLHLSPSPHRRKHS